MYLFKNCFFKCFGVCAFAFLCNYAYADLGGGSGDIGLIDPACSGQSSEVLQYGYYCDGQVRRACPAGAMCVNGEISRCSAGQCAANADGVCVENTGVQCVNCSGNTPYSNSLKTNCVSCSGAGVYVDGSLCKDCPNIPYNQDFYEAAILEGQTGIASCGLKLKSTITGACIGKVISVDWVYDSENQVWNLSNLDVDIGDFDYVAIPENAEDALVCGACEDGTINENHELGINACIACPAGYCSGADGQCQLCAMGHYCPLDSDGTIYSCDVVSTEYMCPKGTFSATGQSKCTSCAAGYTTYNDGTTYNPDTDILNNICKKIQIKLKFGENDSVAFPNNLKSGKVNNSVIIKEP